jgi:hypothetical protein
MDNNIPEHNAVEDLVMHLECEIDHLKSTVYYFLKKIKEAKTVDEIMEHKKWILWNWIVSMPLSPGTCYYCQKHHQKHHVDGAYTVLHISSEEPCRISCEYAKDHGVCLDIGSDYDAIGEARLNLEHVMKSKYHTPIEREDEGRISDIP